MAREPNAEGRKRNDDVYVQHAGRKAEQRSTQRGIYYTHHIFYSYDATKMLNFFIEV